MRTALRYAAAIGVMAASFGTLGSASAYAGQISGNPSAQVGVIQQAKATSPDNLQGQMARQPYHRYCRSWGYGYGHHRYCRTWGYHY